MKKNHGIIFSGMLLGIVTFASCTKIDNPEIGLEPTIPSYTITSQEVIPVDNFMNLVKNPIFSLVPQSFLDGQITSTLNTLEPRIKLYRKAGINIKRLNFTYSSTDRLGNPLTLSCHLCYPVSKSDKFDIRTMTLMSNIFVPDNSFIPTNFFCIDELRVFFDAAVVVPDYQGYGTSKQFETNYASPMTDARQSVEALLVAKDIIAKEKNAVLDEKFYTDNIGISRGGMVVLAIQKYLEDCCNESLVKAVNLKGSFMAEVNPFPLKRFNAMKDGGSFLNKTSWYLMIPSAYYNFPELMGELKFTDFFNDEFNARKVYSAGKLTAMKDALTLQEWNILEHMTAWGGFSTGNAYDVLSDEMCGSDGTIDVESPQWQAFVRVAEETEYISDWCVKYPLTIAFYENDHMMDFSDVKDLVADLQSRTDQHVKLCSCNFDPMITDDESTIHAMAAFYWLFYTSSHEILN